VSEAPVNPKAQSIGRASAANSVIASDRGAQPLGLRRLWIFAAVAAVETFLLSFLFDSPWIDVPHWLQPVLYANALAKIAILAAPLLAIVAWPRRQAVIEAHNRSGGSGLKFYLAVNVAFFVALISMRLVLAEARDPSLYALVVVYSCLLLATGVSIALLAAPPSFWRRLAKLAPVEIALALAGGVIVVVMGRLAQDSWYALSSATLSVSHWLLTFYEPGALLDNDARTLAVGSFSVQVFGACSGYEGLALVAAFLPLYMWVFRQDLRFPNVLLLFPVALAAIWLLNALRIALLVIIGAHVSPEIAVQGFHSQGGWIGFLFVTLGCIAISRKVSFFAAQPARGATPPLAPGTASGAQAALTFLAPFMALVAASILASAFAPHDQWLYAVKVLAIGAALWWFRGAYLPLLSGASLSSVAIGLAVGALWIATDPGRGIATPLGAWLASLPVWIAAIWLCIRAFGSIALVPVAEELAFRGYLARALVSTRFESVGFGEFRLLAFFGSSLAFGLMHQRWLAAFLAGAVYALLMYRTKRLSDAFVAHAASNAAIMVWAVAARQWSLL
jgi:exosortase E/protease (VPEID-CTERM system)